MTVFVTEQEECRRKQSVNFEGRQSSRVAYGVKRTAEFRLDAEEEVPFTAERLLCLIVTPGLANKREDGTAIAIQEDYCGAAGTVRHQATLADNQK